MIRIKPFNKMLKRELLESLDLIIYFNHLFLIWFYNFINMSVTV